MPDLWTLLEEAVRIVCLVITENILALLGGLVAFVVALASTYDKNTKKFNLMEGIICGCIGMSIHPVLVHYGLGEAWTTFICCAIGFIGTVTIREILLGIINKFIDKYNLR